MARTWTEAQFQAALAAYRRGETTLPQMRAKCGVPGSTFAVEARRRGITLRPKGYQMHGRTRAEHPAWKGGRHLDGDGYVRVYNPDHPWLRGGKGIPYVLEHVMVMERHLRRRLAPGEVVHHRNEIKTDNRLENLELMDAREHVREHRLEDTDARQRDSLGRFA